MKKFTKNIAKEFKHSFGRFIAIMAIVALGVGFLIGVMQATPDMKRSMDIYYRENSAYDADVKGTLGLTEADISAIGALDEVEKVTPVISTDALVSVGGASSVSGRIIGRSFDDDSLNTLTLEEGRFPASDAPGEAVVERSNKYFEKTDVGDTISIVTYGDYGDVYAVTEFTVVGIVSSPDYYYRDARETTNIGTGVVGCVLYVNPDAYDMSGGVFGGLSALGHEAKYTDCYIALKDSEDYEMLTERYKNFVLDTLPAVESVGTERCASLNGILSAAGLSVRAEWYVLDRAETNVSYISFEMNAEKVEDIAGIFPVFFIVVAALVALTSMTRMVEEDRLQIGTFKALGYSGAKIVSKYLLYCCLASFIGCVAGILIGFSLLPTIFWQAYATLYYLPRLSLLFSPWFAVAVFAVALAGTALVTLLACRASLKEKPAALMQPKAPKPGKRIFLERAGFFWNRLKFKWKATVRNIFRYKRNMILTIVSVMGCTALILTGFGLNDSVQAVTDLQYNKIILYDTTVEYAGEVQQGGALESLLSDHDHLSLYGENGQIVFGSGKNAAYESVDLYLVEDAQQFRAFVDLHERKKSAIINIDNAQPASDGALPVVLAENIAVVYDVEQGDRLTYRSGDTELSVYVYRICENYTGSYVYMPKTAYENAVGTVSDNTFFIKAGVSSDGTEALAEALLGDDSVNSVDFSWSTIETFEGLNSTMGLVIAVLVISAGALAAIVLYNLTNINIDERRREIATLRVLGYKKYEVAGYIYRESAILTIFGALLGLLVGFLLHMFIVSRVNSVMMMFGKTIGWLSYLWAFLLTIAFAAIVYAFMLIKLNRVNMAESLKSNE